MSLQTVKEAKSQIKADIDRFCRLHMWFRYLPIEGKEYLIFPWKGEQPRNPIKPDVNDIDGLHWWIWDSAFIDEIPISGVGKDILMRHKFQLNCFLRGEEPNPDGTTFIKGWSVITAKYPDAANSMKDKYPGKQVNDYYRLERLHQVKKMILMAVDIFLAFKSTCPEWLTTDVSVDNDERQLNRNFSMDSMTFVRNTHDNTSTSHLADDNPHEDPPEEASDHHDHHVHREHHHGAHLLALLKGHSPRSMRKNE